MFTRSLVRFPKLVLWLMLLTVASAQASTGPTHEIRIIRHAEVAPLHFADWLVDEGTPYTFQVLSPPIYGDLIGETYHPQEAFWSIGADLVGLEIRPAGGVPFHCNLLLVARTPTVSTLVSEDFEDGFPTDWEVDGNPNLIQWVSDSGAGPALHAYLPATTESVLTGPPSLGSHFSNGYHAQGGAGSFILDPPKFDHDGHVVFLMAQPDAAGNTNQLYLQLRHRDGGYAVRASSACHRCTILPTPWRDVPARVPVRFDVWSGPVVYRIDPTTGYQPLHRAARLTLDVPGAAAPVIDWLTGEFDLEPFQIGFVAPQGLSAVGMSIPDLEVWEEVDGAPPTLVTTESFEDGGFDPRWSAHGPLSVSAQAALSGVWGAEIDLGALRQNNTGAGLLVDDVPIDSTRLGALVQVDFASLDLKYGERLDLVGFGSMQDARFGSVLRLLVRSSNGVYQLRLRVKDNMVWRSTPWVSITKAPHALGVKWRAGTGDGFATLWVDGVPMADVTGLTNPMDRVSSVGFGVLSSTLGASASGMSPLRFDDVAVFH